MDEIDVAVLHRGATRPASLLGVPIDLAVMILMLAAIIGVFWVPGPVLGVPAWFAARLLVAKDFHAPRVWMLWWNGSARAWDAHIWGGVSRTPLPLAAPRRFRGIRP